MFERDLLSYLIDNGGLRIRSVRTNYISFINEIIATGLNDGKAIREITLGDELFYDYGSVEDENIL